MDSTPEKRQRQPQTTSEAASKVAAVHQPFRAGGGESQGTAAPYFHLISLAAFSSFSHQYNDSTSRSRCTWAGPSNTDRVVCMKDTHMLCPVDVSTDEL